MRVLCNACAKIISFVRPFLVDFFLRMFRTPRILIIQQQQKKDKYTSKKKGKFLYRFFVVVAEVCAKHYIFGATQRKTFFFRHLFSLVLPRVILCFLFCVRRFKLRWFFFRCCFDFNFS